MVQFKLKDLRNVAAYPNNVYRFSRISETDLAILLERDYLGENPMHYLIDNQQNELIIANNIADIKIYLDETERLFTWERVRAVHNNTKVTLDDLAFQTACPDEEEIDVPLQKHYLQINASNLPMASKEVKSILESSLQQRLSAINDKNLGILLSGGLDSMSIAYLLSKTSKKLTAFTLKTDEDDNDIVKSRQIAQQFSFDLVEVKLIKNASELSIIMQKYNSERQLQYEEQIKTVNLDQVIIDSLTISGNPKKDNLYCAAAMYLIAPAIQAENISTVFSGEGPNEMFNDYGFNPKQLGYFTENKADVRFREALTFGEKKTDRQLGRGGLAKHAAARMSKICAAFGIRLESPYFNKDIAKIMTNIPHNPYAYDTIKQHFVSAMFAGENLDHFIQGTAKEKFQDGSGVSRLLAGYHQEHLIDIFEKIYGVKKTGYLVNK